MLFDDSKIFAILGPTNTGKTYLAFERLLSYKSGIFGFPLRLLARENYEKAVRKIKLLSRIDTLMELEYYKAGGILQYVLNSIVNKHT